MAGSGAAADPDSLGSTGYQLKKYLLLLATLVATVTYAAGLNLPGGSWLEDSPAGGGHLAGDSILRETNYRRYIVFYYFNAISFAASLLLSLLLLLLHRDGSNSYLLLMWTVMLVDVLGLMGVYAAGGSHDVFTTACSAVMVSGASIYAAVAYVERGSHPRRYKAFFFCNTAAFTASLVAIMLTVDYKKIDLEERVMSRRVVALYGLIITALLGLGGAYAAGSCRDRKHSAYVILLVLPVGAWIALQQALVLLLRRCRSLIKGIKESNFVNSAKAATPDVVITNAPSPPTSPTSSTGAPDASVTAAPASSSSTSLVSPVVLDARAAGPAPSLTSSLASPASPAALHAPAAAPTIGLPTPPAVPASTQAEASSAPPGAENQVPNGSPAKCSTQCYCQDVFTVAALDTIVHDYITVLSIAASSMVAGNTKEKGDYMTTKGYSSIQDHNSHNVGDPILLTTHPGRYKVFFYFNSAAFVASIVIVIMLQNEHLVRGHALEVAMILDFFGLIGAYAAGSCRDTSTSIYTVALAGGVLFYVVIHIVFFTLDHSNGDEKKHKYENHREVLPLLAILAATLTYQAGMTPPGGFWEEDDNKSGHHAGFPVLQDKYPRRYKAFFYCNAASFMASVALIVLLLNPNLYRPGIRCYALIVCMVAVCLTIHLHCTVTTKDPKPQNNPTPPINHGSTNNPTQSPSNVAAKHDSDNRTQSPSNVAEETAIMYLMLVGILAASVTYLTGLKPPGGMWRDDGNGYSAGNPVLYDINKVQYNVFFYSNSISFVASIVIIALLLLRMMLWPSTKNLEDPVTKNCKDHPKMKQSETVLGSIHAAMLLDMLFLLVAYAAGSVRESRRSWKVIMIFPVVVLVVFIFFFISRKQEEKAEDSRVDGGEKAIEEAHNSTTTTTLQASA
ncbi:unnamed protein product [Urochloa decumbens]|uniref:PGG domain-containing protein n=1 Tax=Urochloa decumbens TaxID=240449 RepID=A0ABC9AJ10_9POAL